MSPHFLLTFFKCYIEWLFLRRLWNAVRLHLLSILLPHRQRAVLYLYFESCQWCAETRWNLTWVPPLSSIFSVSVWCSTEVTASVDTVPTIMLDNEHSAEQIPPVLSAQQQDKFAELPLPSVSTRAKQYVVRQGWEDISKGIPPAISFFLCEEGRLPEVSFFWASLMEREIIMSWPVNNCMAQWDICHYDMLYVLHPWRSLTKQRGAFAFSSSSPPTLSSAIYCRQTNTLGGRCRGGKKEL